MTPFDLPVNTVLILVDVAILAAAWRFPRSGLALALFLGGLSTLVAAVVTARGYGDGFAGMRAASWALFLHGPLVLGAVSARSWAVSRERSVVAAVLAVGLAAVAVDAFWIEPQALEIRRWRLPSPEVTRPIRVVVLADVQSDRFGAYEADAFARAMAESPDLIVLPGDFVQAEDRASYATGVAAFRRLLSGLSARDGVWAVQGNAEQRASWADDLFRGTSATASPTTVTVARDGYTLTAVGLDDGFDPRLVLPGAEGFHVAFAHGPDFALSPDVGADLLIAGHTHGGQVSVPFFGPPLTLSRVPHAWAAGEPSEVAPGRWLVVSRGVGMERGWAPRLRFGCRPEILVIDVVPGE